MIERIFFQLAKHSLNLTLVLTAFACAAGITMHASRLEASAIQNVNETTNEDSTSLTFRGRVIDGNGQPARGASVEVTHDEMSTKKTVIEVDKNGTFEFRDPCLSRLCFHATAEMGSWQGIHTVSSSNARTQSQDVFEIHLKPTVEVEFQVRSDGKPVSGAKIAQNHPVLGEPTTTDDHGRCTLLLPQFSNICLFNTWHGNRAQSSFIRDLSEAPETLQQIELPKETVPHTIRIVNSENEPIVNQEFRVQFRSPSGLAGLHPLHKRFVTNQHGIIQTAFATPDTTSVEILDLTNRYRTTETQFSNLEETTTIKVAVGQKVKGKILGPNGADLGGILILCDGFGSRRNLRDFAYARTNRDGVFELFAKPNFGYAVSAIDTYWLSNHFTGVLVNHSSKTQEVEPTIQLIRGIEQPVLVQFGKDNLPVPNATLYFSQETERFNWIDASGKTQLGSFNHVTSCATDENGKGSVYLAPEGTFSASLSSGSWHERRNFETHSSNLQPLKFHRSHIGARTISGNLVFDSDQPEQSMNGLEVFAFSRPYEPSVELKISGNSFSGQLDANEIIVVAKTQDSRQVGIAKYSQSETESSINLRRTTEFAGRLVDGNRNPVAGRRVVPQISLATSRTNMNAELSFDLPDTISDADGRFVLKAVPTEVVVGLMVEDTKGDLERFELIFLEDGESREETDYRLSDRTSGTRTLRDETLPSNAVTQSKKPLSDRLTFLQLNLRLNDMHGMIVLSGDSQAELDFVRNKLYARDHSPDFVNYLPLWITRDSIESSQTMKQKVAELGWPIPPDGSIQLVAIDAAGNILGQSKAFDVANTGSTGPTTQNQLNEFVKKHLPAQRDAQVILDEALQEAKKSDRLVWVQLSGPRCAPCFKLSRWINKHRAELEKNLVIIRLEKARDKNTNEVVRSWNVEHHGIPWVAILKPDGSIWRTGNGPLGNIGYPSSFEDQAHLKTILFTPNSRLSKNDIDRIVGDLENIE